MSICEQLQDTQIKKIKHSEDDIWWEHVFFKTINNKRSLICMAIMIHTSFPYSFFLLNLVYMNLYDYLLLLRQSDIHFQNECNSFWNFKHPFKLLFPSWIQVYCSLLIFSNSNRIKNIHIPLQSYRETTSKGICCNTLYL